MSENEHDFINRIFSLLDCFSVEAPELGVREAARISGMSPSTCGRLMTRLRDEGILIQNHETRAYSLGGRVTRWASVYTASSDLRHKAYPFMEQIFRETNETVTLYHAEEFDRVCVERLESHQNVRIVEMVGTRIQLYTGSGGKAILAFRSDEEIEKVIHHAQNQADCTYSEADFEALRCELNTIRSTGYAISHGEWMSDASGIAAPILNERGTPVAAISISGPTQRFLDKDKLLSFSKLLLDNVRIISREMGYYSENFYRRAAI